jgi:hypothetical protein
MSHPRARAESNADSMPGDSVLMQARGVHTPSLPDFVTLTHGSSVRFTSARPAGGDVEHMRAGGGVEPESRSPVSFRSPVPDTTHEGVRSPVP